jgi:hypothetical protein
MYSSFLPYYYDYFALFFLHIIKFYKGKLLKIFFDLMMFFDIIYIKFCDDFYEWRFNFFDEFFDE